ncbi:MAG: hypothetical protein ACYTFI_27080, partial [Planctomycetota bacterium]
DEIKRDRDEFGDEIGLHLGNLSCEEHERRFRTSMHSFWLYSRADKRAILEMTLEKYEECFGALPVSVAAYVLDASSLELLSEMCPTMEICVASCFEEGVKVFHGCNNSWYLFNEGGPWAAWYPAKQHNLLPAENEEDAVGVVAVCHLSRDLALSYESRNDFWASHPANAQRGLGNLGPMHNYDFNLIDLYRAQEELNGGYSYYNVFVGAGWLTHNMNIEDSIEVTRQIYREQLEYFVQLRDEGQLTDMTMSEFGRWFRENRKIGEPEVFLAKELLYGSGKHYFWYIDPKMRVLIDACQGGSIGDLRPYVGRCACFTGPDSPWLLDGSYPYLIQSQYRSGVANHCYDGARATLAVTYGDETIDTCTCKTSVEDVVRDETGTTVRLTPAQIDFEAGLRVAVRTTYTFPGDGTIGIEREVVECSDPDAELILWEYFKGCYGTTEYPEDMHGITLHVEGDYRQSLAYEYSARTLETANAKAVAARIPQINTEVRLEAADGPVAAGRAIDGILFSPFYTLILEAALKTGGVLKSRLRLSRA